MKNRTAVHDWRAYLQGIDRDVTSSTKRTGLDKDDPKGTHTAAIVDTVAFFSSLFVVPVAVTNMTATVMHCVPRLTGRSRTEVIWRRHRGLVQEILEP